MYIHSYILVAPPFSEHRCIHAYSHKKLQKHHTYIHIHVYMYIYIYIVIVALLIFVAVFPPSPAGSCPSYHFNASSPKMLRGNYGQFFNFIFCQFKRLFRGRGGEQKNKN